MKNKKIAIYIETISLVMVLLAIYYIIARILPKIIKISETTYLLIVLFIFISTILVCLRLVYDKNKKASFSYFLKRLRFKKITKKTMYRAIGVFLIAAVLGGLIKLLLIHFEIPFNGNERFEIAKKYKLSAPPFFFMLLTVLVTVIFGPLEEEILFRGYLLPKQEAALGGYAWILNGFAFTFMHLLVYDIPTLFSLFLFSFLVAYKVQKHKDTSIGLLAHFFMNLPFVIKLFML
ncbi:MAG: CPBP family glutamic-type intramembrane protease [Polaribacter sp.]